MPWSSLLPSQLRQQIYIYIYIHSFKVGRVGDEEIFVKLQVNVSHVAWLLKPKLGDSLEVQCHCRHLKIKVFHPLLQCRFTT